MKIGFYTVFRKDPQHYVLAERLIASARTHMPGVPIIQLTDENSPVVPGVDDVYRLPHGKMLQRRIEHYQAVSNDDWLLLDTDTIVQRDVSSVFDDQQFGVAFCDRNWPHLDATPALTKEMPFNTGVVFSRSPKFWHEVLKVWLAFPPEQQASWLSEQQAVAQVARVWGGRIRVLDGQVYNYPPASAEDPGIARAAIVHYKGQRKEWMARLPVSPTPVPVQPRSYYRDPVATQPMRRTVEDVKRVVGAREEFKKHGIDPLTFQSNEPPLRVFIGYDPRQPVAFHVAAHSVQTRASRPVAITRLQLNQLPMDRRGLTEFTYSRYLVPYLSQFEGWSVFLDADMLMRGDIYELIDNAKQADSVQPRPVWVVKSHKRFEWASLMVFNNDRCRTLVPHYVNNPTTPLADFSWAGGEVGALPKEWNHLVGYDTPNPHAKNVHFTMGVPCWPETAKSEFSEEWHREREALYHTVAFDELMGGSVHTPHLDNLAKR